MSGASDSHPLDLLSPYLDDELSLDERASVDRHLVLCESCRDHLESLRALQAALRDEAVPDLPADLVERVGRRIDRATVVPLRRRGRFVLPVSIAATVAAVGLLVALQWRGLRTVAPSTPVFESPPPASRSVGGETGAARQAGSDLSPAPAPAPARAAAPARGAEPKPKTETLAEPAEGSDSEVADAVKPAPQAEPSDSKKSAWESDLPRVREKDALDREEPLGNSAAAAAPALSSVAARRDERSVCGDRWVDSSVLASWSVDDAPSAARELTALASDLGGRSEWRPVNSGDPFAIIVPRSRFEDLRLALAGKGVTGLAGPITLEEGFDCVRQRVAIEVETGSPTAPR